MAARFDHKDFHGHGDKPEIRYGRWRGSECLLCMSAGQREQEFLIDGLASQDYRGPLNVLYPR